MNIQINRAGKWQEVSKQEFLELVSDGAIEPDTEVIINDKKGVAGKIKGLVFPDEAVVDPLEQYSFSATIAANPGYDHQAAEKAENDARADKQAKSCCLVMLLPVFALIVFGLISLALETPEQRNAREAERIVKQEERARAKAEKTKARDNAHARADKLTLANFYRIKTGMTLSEVISIVDEPSAMLSEVEMAGIYTVTLQWDSPYLSRGSNMIVTLQNRKVTSKSQFGLK